MVENQTVVVEIVDFAEGTADFVVEIVGFAVGTVGFEVEIVGFGEGIVGSGEGIVGFGESPAAVMYLVVYFVDFGYLAQFVALYQLEYFQ